jgi:hypothetical protein
MYVARPRDRVRAPLTHSTASSIDRTCQIQ